MLHHTKSCSCEKEIGMSKAHRPHYCQHGALFVYSKPLNRKSPSPKARKPMKRGKGFAASKAQREKVRDLPCVVCGRDRHEAEIQAAHVYPRRLQSCSCADGVVPLCSEDHSTFDDLNRPFDLLPYLAGRYDRELVHAVAEHGVPISYLLEQVSGVKWEPAQKEAA